jgi:hypothetical protein
MAEVIPGVAIVQEFLSGLRDGQWETRDGMQ